MKQITIPARKKYLIRPPLASILRGWREIATPVTHPHFSTAGVDILSAALCSDR